MAKKVVYIVNQYAPSRTPRRFISVVIWTIFLDTDTHAAAHAYARSSNDFPEEYRAET
jgi:hypothetical protein